MIPGSKYNLLRQERSRQKTGTYAGVGKVSLGNGKRWTMNQILLLTGIVIVICILSGRLIDKLGVPSLLAFILLGMCFGVDGIFKISFDDYQFSELICSVSLIFIMFYGGFGTNIKEAGPVIHRAVLLSTAGVLFTAGITGLFIHLALKLPLLESFLVASVIGSTDAASVFNILRSKNLNLKENTASLLEMESGSNDPVSYMLTVILTAVLTGQSVNVGSMLVFQILFGIGCGVFFGKVTAFILNKVEFDIAQGKTILVFATAILAYTIPSMIGGNGYLSVYLCGILLGNSYLPHKRDMVLFFDVLTGVAQMMIFFLLGLLVTPSQLPQVIIPSFVIMIFLTLVGRPVSVAALLAGFRASIGQMGLVSWAGLRGVASIVFAIYVVLRQVPLGYNLFNLVFCIVLLSISIQGTLLPWISGKLQMIDENADVRRTFNDYQEEESISFVKFHLFSQHPYVGKCLKEITLPPKLLVVVLIRGKEVLVPNGDTCLQAGDLMIAAAEEFEDRKNMTLREITVDKNHKWKGRSLSRIPMQAGTLIVMIRRGKETVIPTGNTVVYEGDVLVQAKF